MSLFDEILNTPIMKPSMFLSSPFAQERYTAISEREHKALLGYKADAARLVTERDKARLQVAELTAARDEAAAQTERVAEKLHAAEKARDGKIAELGFVRQDRDSILSGRDVARAERNEARQHNAQLREVCAERAATISKLMQSHSDMEKRIRTLEGERDQMAREKTLARTERDAARFVSDKTNAERIEAEKAAAILSDKLVKANREIDYLRQLTAGQFKPPGDDAPSMRVERSFLDNSLRVDVRCPKRATLNVQTF